MLALVSFILVHEIKLPQTESIEMSYFSLRVAKGRCPENMSVVREYGLVFGEKSANINSEVICVRGLREGHGWHWIRGCIKQERRAEGKPGEGRNVQRRRSPWRRGGGRRGESRRRVSSWSQVKAEEWSVMTDAAEDVQETYKACPLDLATMTHACLQ